MGNLTKNISRFECECKCGCGQDTIDYELVSVVQDMVDYFENLKGEKLSLTITSANRCPGYNMEVGGTWHSQHPKGRAMDVVVSKVKPSLVYEYFNGKYPDKFGLGRYDDFVHIDTRGGKARW